MIPKFRAWDERAGLTEVVSIDFVEKKLKVNHWEYGDSIYLPLDDIELMQSTGLKDKNGVEIFEGDIVRVIGDALDDDLSVVSFTEGGFYLDYKNLDTEFELLYSTDLPIEIAGNIHEDKELLEVK